MRYHVAKMHGAANDFVVLHQELKSSHPTADEIRFLCDRRRGIGADGLLHMEKLPDGGENHFRMHFFNSDGGRASLCLNGSRCCIRRAVQLGWVQQGEIFRFATEHRSLQGQDQGETITLWIDPPPETGEVEGLPGGDFARRIGAMDLGDPHLVLEVDRSTLEDPDFEEKARPLRQWRALFPDGSNVHFVQGRGPEFSIRSFERGVEAETLACGSGCIAAAAVLAGKWIQQGEEVKFHTRGGDILSLREDGPHWRINGPAETVFESWIEAPEMDC